MKRAYNTRQEIFADIIKKIEGRMFMTMIKERAVEMIQRMPEEDMLYVINILQNLEAMSADKEKDKQKAKNALRNILEMEKRLPEDFDPEKELQEARMEKYGRLS